LKIREEPVLRSFSFIRLGFFSLLEIVIGWLVPSTQKIPLAENRFLQAGNGAEIIKEKSVLYGKVTLS